VHHAIEQQWFRNFPDVLSPIEMNGIGNLRGIPIGVNNTLHLSDIRKAWNQFGRDYPDPTLEDFERMRDEIDRKYGCQFLPPVGGGE
jgi:hypothetical protein